VGHLVKPITPAELQDAIIAALSPAPSEPQAAAAPLVGGRQGLRVLLAEDNAINRLVAIHVLKRAGHQVVVAVDGQDALAALKREAFDLVLMDVQMPSMDGFAATALIRAEEKTTGQHIPIVAMTAHALKGDRERCLEAGMDAYVPKPFDDADLFSAMSAAVGVAEQSAPGEEACHDAGPPTTGAVLPAGGERETAPVQTDGDFRALLAEAFLGACPRCMSEIGAAIASRDALRLERAAHKLKGSVGVFKDRAAIEAAGAVEAVGRDEDWSSAAAATTVLTQEIARLTTTLSEPSLAGAATIHA
jgi:CheY-like chemotaxis protein